MARKTPSIDLEALREDFKNLQDPIVGKKRIKDALAKLESNQHEYLGVWYNFSKESKHVYPSQGLLHTPFDYLPYKGHHMLPSEVVIETLRMRRFFLEMFNHPYRIHHLELADKTPYIAPKKVECAAIENGLKSGLALSIGDLGSSVVGSDSKRLSRRDLYAQGPFVKLGKYARTFFVSSASPDIWNAAPAIATMAASFCLAAIPRNGVLSDIKRQADVAKETFEWLEKMADEILEGRDDKKKILGFWKRNIIGVVDSSPEKVIVRAQALYDIGIRSFRIYSPEPGNGPVETVKVLRQKFGDEIEIFTGQIVDVEQAKAAEAAGADGIYIGIGGGGRCITGVRSGSAIDWPQLLWQFRGEINIPVIVEGGASDNVAVTLLLGAAGIGVTRIIGGGTIESPGGLLYCIDEHGKLFKPYGGEASARTKYLDGKLLPFDIPAFVEGEVTKAEMNYIKHIRPTLTYNLHTMIEDSILALVFRSVGNIYDLQAINPSPIKRITTSGDFQRKTH